MQRHKPLLAMPLVIGLIAAGCGLRPFGGRFRPASSGTSATAVPLPTDTPRPPSTPVSATAGTLRTPVPTFDMIGYLVTQAYALTTPAGPAAATPSGPTPSPERIAGGSLPSATPKVIAPPAVIVREPANVPGAVSTAVCEIRGVGPCTPLMPAGTDLYLTWTFGVRGSEPFRWGDAAVAVTRDGKPYLWTRVSNGLLPPPGEDKESVLLVGQQSEFRAGPEDLPPGSYSARLVMCRLSVAECAAGTGWGDVGGESIRFAIAP